MWHDVLRKISSVGRKFFACQSPNLPLQVSSDERKTEGYLLRAGMFLYVHVPEAGEIGNNKATAKKSL